MRLMPVVSACVKCTADLLMFYGCLGVLPWSETGAWYILKQAQMRWLSIGVHWMRGAARAYAVRVCGDGGGGDGRVHVDMACARWVCAVWGVLTCLQLPYARRVDLSDSEDCMFARNAIWV